VTPESELKRAIGGIKLELGERLRELTGEGKLVERQRLEQRTLYDLESWSRPASATGSRTTRAT